MASVELARCAGGERLPRAAYHVLISRRCSVSMVSRVSGKSPETKAAHTSAAAVVTNGADSGTSNL